METPNTEKITKTILGQSKLEISNPGFNKALMAKIRRQKRKQVFIRNLVLYALIFITIDSFILTLLKLMKIKLSEVPDKLGDFIHNTHGALFILLFYLLICIVLYNRVLSSPSLKNQE